ATSTTTPIATGTSASHTCHTDSEATPGSSSGRRRRSARASRPEPVGGGVIIGCHPRRVLLRPHRADVHQVSMVTRARHVPMPPINAHVSSLGGSPIRALLALAQDPSVISFGGGAPASESFDVEGIGKSYQRVLEEHGARALQYSSTEGEPELREAVAARMTHNGLHSEADDVLITSGSQQGLGLVGQVILDPDSIVLT